METIVKTERVEVKLDGELLLHDVSFEMGKGELVSVVGPSGCGKTLLGKLVAGVIQSTKGVFYVQEGVKAVFVEQQDNFFAQSGMRNTYYSQRYEFFEGRAVPTVATLLGIDADNWEENKTLAKILIALKLDKLMDRQLLMLSNGERKRVQLASAWMSGADLLVFDQPFIGLDVHSREILRDLLLKFKELGKSVLLICSKKELPDSSDRVLEMKKGAIVSQLSYTAFVAKLKPETNDAIDIEKLHLPQEQAVPEFGDVVKMTNVRVNSGEKTILQGINWTVRDHERWLLAGHNGSGKSTLLSLVTADNPQGYTNDLVLFGKQRGSGETVWDIKSKIGFVSPELHLYFMRQTKLTGLTGSMQHSVDCLSVVLSGFNEEIGFSSHNTVYQEKMAKEWLSALGLQDLIKKQFAEISLGEQRMLLLIRALIKNPPLLILDEPCQGIDYEQSQRFVHLLDAICTKLNTTMIYVTHAVDEIPACVTHKLELEQGNVKFCGELKA